MISKNEVNISRDKITEEAKLILVHEKMILKEKRKPNYTMP